LVKTEGYRKRACGGAGRRVEESGVKP